MKPGLGILGAVGMLAAAAAVAEPEPGSRIDPTPGSVRPQNRTDAATGRRVLRTFAFCLARARPRVAEAALTAPYLSGEQGNIIRRSVGGVENCMGYSGLELGFQANALPGGLAEQALEGRLARAELGSVAQLTQADIERLGLVPRNGYEDLALCVVRRDPGAVKSFVTTEPATPAERAAFQSVLPNVGPCVNQGQGLRLDMPGLRAMVAVGLYRILTALGRS